MHSSKSCAPKQRLCLNTSSTHHGTTATSLIDDLPGTTVVMVLDLGQNYACFYQDEAQDAHWFHNQVNVHTKVAYYKCHKVEELVKEDLSPGNIHDSSAVAFLHQAIGRLKEKRDLSIQHLLQFTDGKGKLTQPVITKLTAYYGKAIRAYPHDLCAMTDAVFCNV